LSSSGSPESSVNIETNVQDWIPQQTTTEDGYRIEQPNRPRNNWQKVDYTVNNWRINAGQDPIDLKIDARIWDGELDLSGIDLRSFQLADLNSQSVIRFDHPANLFDTFVIDSVRSNMKVHSILNSGAKNVILKVPAGNYLLDFSGKLQQNMSAVITTGMGKTRIEIADSANVQITYSGQTRKATIEDDWSLVEGTTYVHSNPGYLLDIVINSDQGDLEVVIVK
jgi:ribosomal silencing factor RsfS